MNNTDYIILVAVTVMWGVLIVIGTILFQDADMSCFQVNSSTCPNNGGGAWLVQ